MFGRNWKREMVDVELDYTKKRLATVEAEVAKFKAAEYEGRTWKEQGVGTGIQTLQVPGGTLMRTSANRLYFMPGAPSDWRGRTTAPTGPPIILLD